MTTLPFTVKQFEYLGRSLVAARHFDLGDTVWEECPPLQGASVQQNRKGKIENSCVTCCMAVNDDLRCSECNLPCCSTTCAQASQHRDYECVVYKNKNIPSSRQSFDAVVYIRGLMYKEKEPEKHALILTLSGDFSDLNVKFQESFKREAQTLWQFASEDCGLDVSYDEVLHLLCIFQINNFGFESYGFSGQLLCHYGSLFAHSCAPAMGYSVTQSISEHGEPTRIIRYHARRSIVKGELLTVSYASASLVYGTERRQEIIKRNRGFTCQCYRCRDATEEDNFRSAISCSNCKEGYLLPISPTDPMDTLWKCDQCKHSEESSAVQTKILFLEQVPNRLFSTLAIGKLSVHTADEYIQRKTDVILHANHYLVYICATHWLRHGNFISELKTAGGLTLFQKILRRAHRFVPMAFEVDSWHVNADMLLNLAHVFSAYYFEGTELMLISEEKFELRDKLRAARRIVYLLDLSLTWTSMKLECPCCVNKKAYLEQKLIIWNSQVEKFLNEIDDVQSKTIESIRVLFSAKKGPCRNRRKTKPRPYIPFK